ncbi:MAG: Omp28 family outer membrane lipoprotein [Bacteroidaceae bacterium]|nr:Omp28 family outer membrane lipoprotein [Bacteroidaceae bacterium]
MKKHLIYIIGIAAALFTACENISENERFLEVEGVTAQRVVLLEDYTGQACPNCPNAHDMATELHEEYHDNLIVVAMHAGAQAYQAPVGLKTEEGDEYADYFGVKTYPNGLVNRRGGLKDYPSWGAAVYEELQRESNLNLSVSSVVSEGKLTINTELLALEDVTGKLQLWITEDSIIGFQLFPNNKSEIQYVHNHVFRGSVNGTWGEDVMLTLGEQKVVEHKELVLDVAWKPENLSVVAFVYNNDGVLQAAQCKVMINE